MSLYMLRFTREVDRLVDPTLFLYMPPYSSLLVAWHICVHALFQFACVQLFL